MNASGYSLWLMPEEGSAPYKFARSLIEDLSAIAHGPIFLPHVTLIGGVEGSQSEMFIKTKQLARQLKPYAVELKGIATKCDYFRGFFAEVEQSTQVIEANAIAQKVFDLVKDYYPHMSLSYYDYADDALKKLASATKNTQVSRGNFTARSVHLYHTKGRVDQWKLVDEFPFGR